MEARGWLGAPLGNPAADACPLNSSRSLCHCGLRCASAVVLLRPGLSTGSCFAQLLGSDASACLCRLPLLVVAANQQWHRLRLDSSGQRDLLLDCRAVRPASPARLIERRTPGGDTGAQSFEAKSNEGAIAAGGGQSRKVQTQFFKITGGATVPQSRIQSDLIPRNMRCDRAYMRNVAAQSISKQMRHSPY